jgi:ATP-binding cassette subfamily B protein
MKDFPYLVLLRATLKYVGEYRGRYILALMGVTISSMIFLTQPYFMGQFFNAVQAGLSIETNFKQAILMLFFYFIAEPISWSIWMPSRLVERQSGYFVRRNFVKFCYDRLQRLPYAWHQNFHTGQLYDRVRKAESALEDFTSHQFRFIISVFNLIGPIVALLILFKWFGLIAIAIAFVAGKMVLYFDKKLIPLYEQRNKLEHSYAGVFGDYLANIRTIIALRLGRQTETELLHRYEQRRPTEWKEYRINEWKWCSVDVFADFIIAAMIFLAIYVAKDESALKIGNLVMLFQYLVKFSGAFTSIGWIYQDVTKYAANYKSISMIEEDYLKYKQMGLIAEENQSAERTWQDIAIRDVGFAYEDSEHRPHALKNIDIDLHSGEKIAFVGESGAGKSTLMTVLRGLYRADKGNLTIDGQSYPDLSPLGAMTTFIPQDPEIFENTIRYNITFGVEHTDEEILNACRMAGFDNVLADLPKGLESDIREKGVNLSGGQKQRLALARGVFAIENSSLILMDEPTSSVDMLTELQIFDRLFTTFKDKTIVASVHRLHLLPRFDRIYFMEKGCIIEQGSLAQLLAAKGKFAALWQEYQEEQAHDQ